MNFKLIDHIVVEISEAVHFEQIWQNEITKHLEFPVESKPLHRQGIAVRSLNISKSKAVDCNGPVVITLQHVEKILVGTLTSTLNLVGMR